MIYCRIKHKQAEKLIEPLIMQLDALSNTQHGLFRANEKINPFQNYTPNSAEDEGYTDENKMLCL